MKFIEREKVESDLNCDSLYNDVRDIRNFFYYLTSQQTKPYINRFDKNEYSLPIGLKGEKVSLAIDNYSRILVNLKNLFLNPADSDIIPQCIFEDQNLNKVYIKRITIKKYFFDIKLQYVSLSSIYGIENKKVSLTLPFGKYYTNKKPQSCEDITSIYDILKSIGYPTPKWVIPEGSSISVRFDIKRDENVFKSIAIDSFSQATVKKDSVTVNFI